jgi:hypothetical protein
MNRRQFLASTTKQSEERLGGREALSRDLVFGGSGKPNELTNGIKEKYLLQLCFQ